MFSLIIFIFRL